MEGPLKLLWVTFRHLKSLFNLFSKCFYQSDSSISLCSFTKLDGAGVFEAQKILWCTWRRVIQNWLLFFRLRTYTNTILEQLNGNLKWRKIRHSFSPVCTEKSLSPCRCYCCSLSSTPMSKIDFNGDATFPLLWAPLAVKWTQQRVKTVQWWMIFSYTWQRWKVDASLNGTGGDDSVLWAAHSTAMGVGENHRSFECISSTMVIYELFQIFFSKDYFTKFAQDCLKRHVIISGRVVIELSHKSVSLCFPWALTYVLICVYRQRSGEKIAFNIFRLT